MNKDISFNRPDLSDTPGNPANDLMQKYQELMAIEDPVELREAAIAIVKSRLGHGMSEKNYDKFIRTMNTIPNLEKMRFYLSNFILKAAGLGVVNDDIEVIASFITESIGEVQELTEEQKVIKEIVESYGYKVCIL